MPEQTGFVTPLFATTPLPPPPPQPIRSGVGICLSGGGSRAMACGIGQLQALAALRVGNDSLLDRIDFMTTVSGGGWVGIPFAFLPSSVSDAAYLGTYTEPADLTAHIIGQSGSSWIGGHITDGFSIADLAVHAIHLYRSGVPSSLLWQTLMGIHFLGPYGLLGTHHHLLPFLARDNDYRGNSLFSFDRAMLAQDATDANPALAKLPAHLVAQVPGQRRPFLVTVCGMFVSIPADSSQSGATELMLAPVQSTPAYVGMLPVPASALYGGTLQPGGGAVASFAFNSTFDDFAENDTATIVQARQWSLMDALGTSSAAFAALLEDQIGEWLRSPERFAAALRVHGDKAVDKLGRLGLDAINVATSLERMVEAAETGGFDALKGELGDLSGLTSIVPAYDYWSPADPPPPGTTVTQPFADGGSLDNSGITSLLYHPEATKIIAFVNTENALHRTMEGGIIVDSQIPPLFGFRPHKMFEDPPYLPYSEVVPPDPTDLHRFSQVFPSDAFQPLLDGLWAATGGSETSAALYTQQLVTVANDWFGIPAGREITIVWVYLAMAQDWRAEIDDLAVRAILDVELATQNFPHYATLDTQRSATQVNLLANLTAWTVLRSAGTFTALFGQAGSA